MAVKGEAQFVGGVGDEVPVPIDVRGDAVEHAVDGLGKLIQLIAGAADVQPFVQVLRLQPGGSADDLGERPGGSARDHVGPQRRHHHDAQHREDEHPVQFFHAFQHVIFGSADAEPKIDGKWVLGFDRPLADQDAMRLGFRKPKRSVLGNRLLPVRRRAGREDGIRQVRGNRLAFPEQFPAGVEHLHEETKAVSLAVDPFGNVRAREFLQVLEPVARFRPQHQVGDHVSASARRTRFKSSESARRNCSRATYSVTADSRQTEAVIHSTSRKRNVRNSALVARRA